MENSEIPNIITNFDGNDNAPPDCGATNFQDLVNTIRQAEDSLIVHGFNKIEQRIQILRGIYYGTNWSMDRLQTYGSDLRNAGFKLYLCNPVDPINPENILGSTLFLKLRCKPEIKHGNHWVDWGHIIIGLEARLKWCSREIDIPLPPHETSGLEITTWIGDIGGGAGMLAYKRISNPNKRAIDMFNDPNDFGGAFNIEGNMAAYLIGRNTTTIDQAPNLFISDEQYIADAVQAYLLPQPTNQGSEYYMRGRTFLKMLGGELDGAGNLVNEHPLAKRLSKKVQDFAEYYIVNLSTSNSVNFQEVSKHLQGASLEMTYLFINALKMVGNNPNSNAHPEVSFNPNPTPPGEPYESVKFTSAQASENIKRMIEDWLNQN